MKQPPSMKDWAKRLLLKTALVAVGVGSFMLGRHYSQPVNKPVVPFATQTFHYEGEYLLLSSEGTKDERVITYSFSFPKGKGMVGKHEFGFLVHPFNEDHYDEYLALEDEHGEAIYKVCRAEHLEQLFHTLLYDEHELYDASVLENKIRQSITTWMSMGLQLSYQEGSYVRMSKEAYLKRNLK